MRLPAIVVACLLFAACGDDNPRAAVVDTLTVAGAWARPTPATATNGVVYLTVTSPIDDAIVAADVPAAVAGDASLHETMGGGGGASPMPNMPDMTAPGGEMTMEPVEAVPMAANVAISFEPGGYHIMLTGLAAPLVEGAQFELTLTFASGAELDVQVLVAQGPPAG